LLQDFRQTLQTTTTITIPPKIQSPLEKDSQTSVHFGIVHSGKTPKLTTVAADVIETLESCAVIVKPRMTTPAAMISLVMLSRELWANTQFARLHFMIAARSISIA
jgi:hypothetical protein